MRKMTLLFIFPLMLLCGNAYAQVDDEEEKRGKDADLLERVLVRKDSITIDTTFVKKFNVIRNYSMVGVQYGVNMATASMNPTREFKSQFLPVDISILYTRYCKMFDYLPYFGLQAGICFSEQAYCFDKSQTTGRPVYNLLGAYKVRMPVIEIPGIAQLHYDFWKMKIMADIGFYIGYRLGIHREYDDSQCKPEDPRRIQYADKFHANEHRFYYGIQFGGGLGLVFDPVEIHFMVNYKYGLSYISKPNISYRTFEEGEDKSNYYYNWTNMNNLIISVGVHYQLSKRYGSSKKEMREEARRRAAELRSREVNDENYNSENR